MLRHTVERAERVSGMERMLIVAAEHHEVFLEECLEPRYHGRVIFQPRNRDTAPGIFLPLTRILAADPGAKVVILPSDHFVFPESAFLSAVRRAVVVAGGEPKKAVLLGANPDSEETEYGWIEVGQAVGDLDGHPIRRVAGFREKPDWATVRRLLHSGGLWSTMVVAARAQALWELGWRHLPVVMSRFEVWASSIGSRHESEALASMYARLPSANFSTDILQASPESLLVMELDDVIWSDWGTERRIVELLHRLGKRPAFRDAPHLHPAL